MRKGTKEKEMEMKKTFKFECPIYPKKQLPGKKGKKDRKQKKAYIAWENNAFTSLDSSSEEDVANMCLMADSMDDSSTIEEIEVNKTTKTEKISKRHVRHLV